MLHQVQVRHRRSRWQIHRCIRCSAPLRTQSNRHRQWVATYATTNRCQWQIIVGGGSFAQSTTATETETRGVVVAIGCIGCLPSVSCRGIKHWGSWWGSVSSARPLGRALFTDLFRDLFRDLFYPFKKIPRVLFYSLLSSLEGPFLCPKKCTRNLPKIFLLGGSNIAPRD